MSFARQHAAGLEQVTQERQQLAQDLDRLNAEIRLMHDQIASLERQRDEAIEQRAEALQPHEATGGEVERLQAERNELQERFDSGCRALEEQAVAHRNDMAQLADEFDAASP